MKQFSFPLEGGASLCYTNTAWTVFTMLLPTERPTIDWLTDCRLQVPLLVLTLSASEVGGATVKPIYPLLNLIPFCFCFFLPIFLCFTIQNFEGICKCNFSEGRNFRNSFNKFERFKIFKLRIYKDHYFCKKIVYLQSDNY